MMTNGRMAKAERKNTICPTGCFSPRKRTSADMTANSSADMILSAIALSACIALRARLASLDRRKRLYIARDRGTLFGRKLGSVAHDRSHRPGYGIAIRQLAGLQNP